MTTPLELALSYNARGWPVFPARAKEEYDEHTGEVLSPKTPYTSNGLRGATKSERIIREWWRRTPDAMVAVPTGAAIDAWVLDLDRKPGVGDGHDWLADMEAKHGPLPETARATTMGGGTHIFFRHVEGIRNRGSLGVAVDVRGEGGYVVAPGSVAADGRRYEWTSEAEIADAPQWLLDLVCPPPVTHTAQPYSYRPGGNDHYVESAMRAELEVLASAAPGCRGYQLNASAFALGTLVGAGALSRSDAEARLYDAAVACGVAKKDGERETRSKIRRGLDAGEKQPRSIPEFQQDNTRLVDVTRMLERARQKVASRQAAAADVVDVRHMTGFVATLSEDQKAAALAYDGPDTHGEPPTPPGTDPATAIEQPEEPATAPGIFITPYEFTDPRTLPRREFAFGTHYIRKYVSVTVSPGGLGKTSNSIVEALSMASGKALLGIKPPQRMRVWLFNAEDPRDEMERRIQAACLHYKLGPDDINGWLFLDTGREQELVVAVEDRKAGVRYQTPIIESVIANLLAQQIDVMIVDPFVSTHGVNENDNGAIDKVAKLWAHIADETNVAVDVVHHLRKVADREATVEDARGAVALIGAARSVRVLNRMSEDQATAANVPSGERFSYFNVHQGKSNLTKMSSAQTWRRLESVALGNGQGLLKPQDHAGVVTEWAWPTKEDVAAAVPEDAMRAAIVAFGNRNYRESPQSDEWAGYALAEALGEYVETSRTMTPEKRRIKTVLDSWIENGILAVVAETDPKHVGRTIKFVRPGEQV